MGNLGIPEIMVILVIALLVFGPNKVPEVARQLGKGLRELRRIQESLHADVSGLLGVDDDNDPTPPFHPTPAPEPVSLPAANVRGAAAPSRFRTPAGQRVARPGAAVSAPAIVDGIASAGGVTRTPVPRVSAPSRFRTPGRNGTTA